MASSEYHVIANKLAITIYLVSTLASHIPLHSTYSCVANS